MNLYEELVNGVGYAVCPIDDIKLFKSLRDSFVGRVSLPTGSKKNINSARRALVNMSLAEINRLRINLLSLTNISEVMIECCSSLVEALCGKDLFIQRRAHVMQCSWQGRSQSMESLRGCLRNFSFYICSLGPFA